MKREEKYKRKTRILKELKEEILKNIYMYNMPFYFDTPKVDAMLYYVENTLEVPEDAKFEVEVMDNFFIEFRCGEPWDYSDDDQRRHRRIDENDEDDDWEDDDELGDNDEGDDDENDDDQIKNPTKTN